MLSLNPLTIPSSSSRNWHCIKTATTAPTRRRRITTSCSQNTEQQLNLSVLRFTLGIPGLDESYLPRYIGYGFGGLLLLNHFLGSSDYSSITNPQLRTEALGLTLAAFSSLVPYLGKFLKGTSRTDQKSVPEDAEQIFVMPLDMADTLKEDLAWATYVLLRNTNSISVLISVEDAFCVRGYWNIPKDISKEMYPDWFRKQLQNIVFGDLMTAKYLPLGAESEIMEMVPDGTRSLLVQPVMGSRKESFGETQKSKGFVMLASSIDYAYNDKDKGWIAAVANKFGGKNTL